MNNSPADHNSNPALALGIAAARVGDKKKATAYLLKALEQDKNSLEGWLWLARVVDDARIRRQCLQVVLKFDPQNLEAQFMQAELDRPLVEVVNPPPVEVSQEPPQPPPPAAKPAVTRQASAPVSPPAERPQLKRVPRWMILMVGGAFIVSLLGLISLLAGYQLGWWGTVPTSPPPIARHTIPGDGSSNLFVEYILDASDSMNETLPDGNRKGRCGQGAAG